jgi:hypothetical protein
MPRPVGGRRHGTGCSWDGHPSSQGGSSLPEVTLVFTIPRLWEVTPTRWTNNRLSLAEIPRPLRDIQVLKMAQHNLVEIPRSSADTQVLRMDILRGGSSFVGGHPSTQAEHPTGNSSFVGGRPSTQEGDGQSNQTCHSAPGVPTDAAGQTAFNSSADNH